MSHKDEAERLLGMTHYDAYPCAQVHATLALVEAQEAVAEQARIANLIALLEPDDPREFDTWPDIARALGIQEEA